MLRSQIKKRPLSGTFNAKVRRYNAALLSSGLYRRRRNLIGSAAFYSRLAGLTAHSRITAGGDLHPAPKHRV